MTPTTTTTRRVPIHPAECEDPRPLYERTFMRNGQWLPDVTEAERAAILDRQRKYPCVPAGKEKEYRASTDYGRVR